MHRMMPVSSCEPGRRGGSRGAVATALCGLAVAAAACSSGAAGSTTAPHDPAAATVRRAPAVTTSAGSATVAVTITSRAPTPTGGPLGIAELDSYNLRSEQGQGTLAFKGLPGLGANLRMYFNRGALYMQATGAFTSAAHGKPWVELNAAALGTVLGGASASSSPGGALDALATDVIGQPLSVLQLLGTGSLTATVVGHPSLGGQTTTEYAVIVHAGQAAAAASGTARRFFDGLGTAPVRAYAWLDAQGRLVQLVSTQATSGATASTGQITGVTVRLANFGTPVSVSLPPASQIAVPSPASSGTPSGTSSG